jgi:hypothetical protein
MERFVDTYDHLKLNQKDINHLNRSITQKKLKQKSRVPQKRKVQDLMDSLQNFIKLLKEN